MAEAQEPEIDITLQVVRRQQGPPEDIIVRVRLSDSVKHLKAKVFEEIGIVPKFLLLKSDGRYLKDESRSLRDCGIQSGSILCLMDNTDSFQISIVYLDGTRAAVQVNLSDTVAMLKEEVCDICSVSTDSMRLIFRTREMEDGLLLWDYGIRPHCSVHCIRRLRGGGEMKMSGTFRSIVTDWEPYKESKAVSQSAGQERRPFSEFEKYKRISCELCGEEDSSEWIVVEPNVLSEAEMVFRISLPGKGHYECAVTRLRWETKKETTISYRYSSWDDLHLEKHLHRAVQYLSPLFNFNANDEEIAAIHLPHFACLKESKNEPSFQIFHLKNSEYSLITPTTIGATHVELKNPSFSLMGVIRSSFVSAWFRIHTVGIIYRTPTAEDVTLHVYILPNDFSILKTVQMQEGNSVKIQKPPQVNSLHYGRKYSLKSPSGVEISPAAVTLHYLSSKQCQQYYEVYCEDQNSNITLELTKIHKTDALWAVLLRKRDLRVSHKEAATRDVPVGSTNAVEFVKRHRRNIIERLAVLDPILRHLFQVNVINEDEQEKIISRTTRSEKNQALMQMITSKGICAQKELYRAMEENDPFLVEDLEENQ